MTSSEDVRRVQGDSLESALGNVVEILERAPKEDAMRRFEWSKTMLERAKRQGRFDDLAKLIVALLDEGGFARWAALRAWIHEAKALVEEIKRIDAELVRQHGVRP